MNRFKNLFLVSVLTTMTALSGTAMAEYIPYEAPVSSSKGQPVEPHSAQALKQAKVAIIHGTAGHSFAITQYASIALTHAQAAEKVLQGSAKAHMAEGIVSLIEAIKHSEMGHAEISTHHVNEAIVHITASID